MVSAVQAADSELWTETVLNFAKTERKILQLSNTTRTSAQNDELYFNRLRFGPEFFLSESLSAGINYSIIRLQTPAEVWLTEHRSDLNLNQRFKALSLALSANLRLEHRLLLAEQQTDFFRSRYGLKVVFPQFDQRVYLFSELFYNHGKSGWEQNRTFLGLTFPGLRLPAFVAVGFQSFKAEKGRSWDFRPTLQLGLKL